MKIRECLLISALVLVPGLARTQEDKAQKLFQAAIEAMGGDAFVKVTDMVSEGNLFYFDRDGNSSGLIKYFDWTKLPDKSRNELGNNKKSRDVVVFNLEKKEGWILEGQKDTREATPEEMEDFKNAVKHNLDSIFRFRYKDPSVKLFYLGPGDGPDVQFEVVRLLDPENDETNVYFDRTNRLPAKIEYSTVDKKSGVKVRNRDEFSQWHVIQGVKTSLRLDSYRNGRKSAQQFVLKIGFNNNLPDSFFGKPVPPK